MDGGQGSERFSGAKAGTLTRRAGSSDSRACGAASRADVSIGEAGATRLGRGGATSDLTTRARRTNAASARRAQTLQ